MILYIENPKDTTRKLLELINEYSKVVGYKINTQYRVKEARKIKTNTVYKCIYIEFRKMVMITLYVK